MYRYSVLSRNLHPNLSLGFLKPEADRKKAGLRNTSNAQDKDLYCFYFLVMILYYCVGGMGPNLYQMQQQAVRHYLQPGMMPQVSRPPLVPDPLGRIRIQKVKEAKTKP